MSENNVTETSTEAREAHVEIEREETTPEVTTGPKRAKKQAIEGTRVNAFAVDPDSLTIIGLDTADGSEHPLFDERIHLPVSEKLVLNMMAYGFTSTIKVRKNGDGVEVVYGRQRVRAAREANKRLLASGCEPIFVVCSVQRGQDADMMGIMVSENEVREPDALLSRSDKAARMLAMGQSEARIAIAFGVSEQSLLGLLKLQDIHPKVRKAIESGKISSSAAIQLADLKREDQPMELAKVLDSGVKATAAEVKRRVAEKTSGEEVTKAPGKVLLRKLLAAPGADVVLGADGIKAIKWMLGQSSARSITGLCALIREVTPEPEE